MTDDEDPPSHPLKVEIQGLDYRGDIDALRVLRRDAQRTVDNRLAALTDIDTKVTSILRINVILLGLVLTAVSIAADPTLVPGEDTLPISELNNPFMFGGILSLILSTALAAMTYTASDVDVGIQQEKLYDAIDADLTEREIELAAAQSYGHWIGHNRRTNTVNALYITLTSALVIVGLVLLSLAVYDAFVDRPSGLLVVIASIGLVGLIIAARVPGQLSDWGNLHRTRFVCWHERFWARGDD
ncbi:MAG: hypothetical protein ACOCUA_02365 [archaeon]